MKKSKIKVISLLMVTAFIVVGMMAQTIAAALDDKCEYYKF